MMNRRLMSCAAWLFCLGPGLCGASSNRTDGAMEAWEIGGHLKYRLVYTGYPEDSLFRDALGSHSLDNSLEVRLKAAFSSGGWDAQTDYQFIALNADTLVLSERLPGLPYPVGNVISDDRRWWNLTHSVGDAGGTIFVNRLDRLNLGYTTERAVIRFGRQAISWGNGLVFTPMDVFNPFDPAAVDKEYKTGDDMLYGQYLFPGGNDLQAVAVVRRDPVTGRVEQDQSSLALKFHGFLDMNEIDLLAAEHFGDTILGVGGIADLGGSIWRGDLTWTRTDADERLSLVTSLSYSWTWGSRNLSGLLEYYYNGFGQADGRYSPDDLRDNPDLLERLARGELYTLARSYLAASASIELTPLALLTPNLLINVEDPSALLQIIGQWDWREDVRLTGALSLPLGPSGSEYGGIPSPVEGRYFSAGAGLFLQAAVYF
jgi:hypothetical protein